jgi:enamine deaminase RidA (YjgF/YER057c/UK114 family)
MTHQQLADKLKEMGYSLPEVARAVGSYVPAVRSGSMVCVSGQLPMREGTLQVAGKLGQDVTLEAAQEGARICVLNGLAAAAQAAGGIEKIARIVRLAVFVNSTPEFTDQAKVANGASDQLQAVFGEAGRHARAAVGVVALPLNAAVEIEMWAQCQA